MRAGGVTAAARARQCLLIKARAAPGKQEKRAVFTRFCSEQKAPAVVFTPCPRGRLVPSPFTLRPARIVMQGQRTSAGNNKRVTCCAIVSTAVFPNSTASFGKVHVTDGSLAQASKFTRKGHAPRNGGEGVDYRRKTLVDASSAPKTRRKHLHNEHPSKQGRVQDSRNRGGGEARVNEAVV